MFPVRKIYFFKMYPERKIAEQKHAFLISWRKRTQKSACGDGKRKKRKKIVLEGCIIGG